MVNLFAILVVIAFNIGFSYASIFLPEGHPRCRAYCESGAILEECQTNTQMYMTLDGRCGCLSNSQFEDAFICLHSIIKCPIKTELTHLYRFIIFGGQLMKAYFGCGCFPFEKP